MISTFRRAGRAFSDGKITEWRYQKRDIDSRCNWSTYRLSDCIDGTEEEIGVSWAVNHGEKIVATIPS